MKDSPFSGRAIVILIACATALFAAMILLNARGQASGGRQYAASTYSVSAIGHAGFYDLLRRMERPVLRSAGSASSIAGTRGTLIIAEPGLRYMANAEELGLSDVPRVLVVLPKWQGTRDEKRPSWIDRAEPVPLGAARQILAIAADMDSSVFRGGAERTEWAVNELGIDPALPDTVQLIRSDTMTPIVGGEDGILLGEAVNAALPEQKIWVLSDPDVLSNHGIVKGANAEFMLAAVDALRSWNTDPSAPIVFEESVHGFREARDSPLSMLLRFPFAIVTALTCIAAALLVLSGARRFGAPVAVKPALDFGKANLISNSARLLDYAGHHAAVLERYIIMTLSSTAKALRAPRFDDSTVGSAAMCGWLDRIGRSRGVSSSCAELWRSSRAADTRAGELARLFKSVRKVYDWKQEILKEGKNKGSAD